MSLSTGNNETLPAYDGSLPRVLNVNAEGQPQASEWLHPAGFDYASFNDNAAIKLASDSGKWAGDTLASIDNLRATPHPEDTPARHARKVREKLDSFDHGWAEKWDATNAALKAELKRVDAELEQSAGLKPDPTWQTAIVGTFQDMKPSERAQALTQLIEQGDHATLATLIAAPLVVSKLSAEQRDTIRLRVLTKINPVGLKLRDYLTKTLDRWGQASIAGIQGRAKLAAGTDRFDGKVKAAEAVAKAAGFAA